MKSDTAFLPTMQMVRVDKQNLIGKLHENRDEHQKAYDESVKGYFKAKIADFKTGAELMKKGEDWQPDGGIARPSNHSGDYSWAISLLERSLDNEVHLQQSEFRQFVMDEWQWSSGFKASTTSLMTNWTYR